jgi:hypothetical protein
LLKPAQPHQGARMSGIGAIVLFIIVFGALNFYEFGRLD